MKSRPRQLPLITGAAIAMLVTAGCAHNDKPASIESAQRTAPAQSVDSAQGTTPAETQNAPAHTDRPGAVAPPAARSADLLARETESYSKSLEGMLGKRGAAQPAPKESAVEWMNKDGIAAANPNAGARSEPPSRADASHVSPADDAKPLVTPAVDLKTSPASKEPSAREVASNVQANLGASTGANIGASVPAQGQPGAKPQAAPGSTEAFEARLAKRVKDYPRDVSAQLEYQLWLYLRDQPVPQLATISSLPSEDREMLTALLDALSNFRSTVRADNNTLLSKKIRPLLEMADRLRSQADLSVPRVALCSSVKGFGQYEPMDTRVAANAETRTILYCEVENFAAQLNEQQAWTSDLKLEAVLYSEDSLQVWADKPETVHDSSRNRRHDFFIRKFVTLPKNVGVGRYLLKVSITDLQANRIAESTLPITFVAQ